MTSYTFTKVTANHTIQAQFATDTHTITATAGEHGSISPSGAVKVNHGQDQAFTIEADEDYRVKDVVVDGTSRGPLPITPSER